MKAIHLFATAALLSVSGQDLAAAEVYKAVVLNDSPFAYYRLDEKNVAQPVADQRRNNPGTFQNAPTLRVGGAIESDGASTAVAFDRAKQQYVWLTNFGRFGNSITNGFTAEYWLKTANAKDHQTVFGVANGPGFTNDFLADLNYGGVRKRLRLYLRDNHWNRYEMNFQPGGRNIDIFDNTWHHIVHVYAPKAAELGEQILLYVDGARQNVTVTHKGGAPVFSDFNHPLTLGAMDLRGRQPDHLDGCLDEVAFYTKILSPAQILKHFAASGASVASVVDPKAVAHR